MSSVDKRVVEMQFDNQQFERNAQTSLGTLDKLKKGLNLDESAKSLSNLDKVGQSFSLAGISAGVESISSRFSALGIMGVTALQNITSAALSAGTQLIKSLTIDPVKTGLSEYETKINAIQTILTNTQGKGTTLTDVNNVLADLNTYADKTIYDFAQMTRNIGTFTAAGVGLKQSATAIKGIANLAAGSGATADQASSVMYQLSQALASGTVKLMDWNSVVNGGMGGQLFQNALKSTAKEMGVNIDASKSFRDSLQDGWLSADVLTKTLEKFANDKSLIQAATQVKTFSQLFDTMKESVQSGWAVSWENIIGNKDEAAKTLTALNDAFNKLSGTSANARNTMLQFWHDNGGRDALIQAITNAFKGLTSVITPIKEAFREIFPPTTGQQLVNISKGLRDLTANFKIGDDTAKNLKDTFEGVFAVFDIGRQAVLALVKPMLSLAQSFLPAGDGILAFTGSIGRWLTSLDESIKKADSFNGAIQKVEDFLKPISDGISKAITNIVDAFKVFGKADLSGLDSFSSNVQRRFEPFTKLLDIFKTVFSKFAEILSKTAPTIFKFAGMVGEGFGKLGDSITTALDNADFNSLFDLVNGGLFAGILLAIKKFIGGLTEVTDGASGFLKGITGILDGVKGSLEAYQKDLQANTLIKIASAIAILSAALLVLSLIDSAKLTSSLVAMSTIMLELFGTMGVFEKIMGSEGFKNVNKVSLAMIGISVAVLILASAMKKLGDLDWAGIDKGLIAVGLLMAMLVKAAKSLSESSGKTIKGATGFVIFAGAILVLTEAVDKLSKLDLGSLAKGLIGVGVLITELALFMKTTDLNGMGLNKGVGLVLLATSLLILAEAVKKFGQLDAGAILKGLGAIAVVLGEVAIFTKLTGDSKHVISTAVGLTILAASMLIFAQAIGEMGNMSWDQLGKGLTAMALALGTVTLAMNLMPKGMPATGLGMVEVATALAILSNALKNMGGMSWEAIAKGLITLAGSLAIITAAVNLMEGALPGAAALLVVAAALAVLTPVLKVLGSMSLAEIGKGLLALAGMFAIIGAAGLLLAPVVPVLLGLAAAVALLGVGALAAGAGLLLFSAGLTALSVAGAAGAASLVAIVMAIVGLIPMILEKVGEGLIQFAEVISEGGPQILDAFSTILTSLVDAVVEVTPKVVDALLLLLTMLLQKLAEYVPQMVQAGFNLLIGILKGIANNIGQVVTTATSVIVNFLNAIAQNLPKVIDAGFKVIISFINGLADAIRSNHQALYNAVENLINAIVEAANDLLYKVFDIGVNIIKGMIDGVKSMAKELWKAAKDVVNGAIDKTKDALGIHSPSKVFAEIGMYTGAGLIVGLKGMASKVASASGNLGKTAISGLQSAISNIPNLISSNINLSPSIRPVLDLSDIEKNSPKIGGLLNQNAGLNLSATIQKATDISNNLGQNGSASSNQTAPVRSVDVKFEQNNYSPKPLPRLDIYRQTRNQLSQLKGAVDSL